MRDEDKKILEMQCASTRRSLERPETEDVEWGMRKLPKESQVKDEYGNVVIGHRLFTDEEWEVATKLQRKRGRYIAEMRGDEVETKPKPEAVRRSAIDRFMGIFSIDAIKVKFKELMSGMPEEKTYAQIMAENIKKVMDE